MIMDIDFGNPREVDYIRIFDFFSFYKNQFPKTLVFGNGIAKILIKWKTSSYDIINRVKSNLFIIDLRR